MLRHRKMLCSIMLAILLIANLAACSRRGGRLDGTRWRLVAWTISSLDPGAFTITAIFAEGQVTGQSAVNTYGGSYRADAAGKFSVGELATTLMAGPEDAMRAERAYLTLLQQARSFKLASGTLTLYDQGGNESLIFEASTP